MNFTKFQITNFKGIENITFDLEKAPEANIYTLVGLNESGKTTILEAINQFNPKIEGTTSYMLPGAIIDDYNSLIPINSRDNFNGTISIIAYLKIEEEDYRKIDEFLQENTPFQKVKRMKEMVYYRHYKYENSKFKDLDSRWTGFWGSLKSDPVKYVDIKSDNEYSEYNFLLAHFCKKLIPSILYFPNFLFEFPSKIYLETKETPSAKESFYINLVQDVLSSLENDTNIKTHLVDRITSQDESDKKSLGRLIQLMERKITDIVFGTWNRIFKRKIRDTKIVIKYDIDDNKLAFIEFQIEADDGIYQINERSLGFRWFFTFLLFTQFRPFRQESPKNIIFLFDEPASNLHSSAQKQLLSSFENLINNAKIIYATHSHYLINPQWLESTYVVKNEGLQIDYPENYNARKTKITIESYRSFVLKHPHNTAYFQPILDVLHYLPSSLENLSSSVLMEGKNDYYTLTYFKNIILKLKDQINIIPSTGSGNLDTLISIFLGWGKDFIILLDSDNEGKLQKERYVVKFGANIEDKIFIYRDINSGFDGKNLENLFDPLDLLPFQKTCYSNSEKFVKTHFFRSVQESLVNKKDFKFSQLTLDNFKQILDFLIEKLNNR